MISQYYCPLLSNYEKSNLKHVQNPQIEEFKIKKSVEKFLIWNVEEKESLFLEFFRKILEHIFRKKFDNDQDVYFYYVNYICLENNRNNLFEGLRDYLIKFIQKFKIPIKEICNIKENIENFNCFIEDVLEIEIINDEDCIEKIDPICNSSILKSKYYDDELSENSTKYLEYYFNSNFKDSDYFSD